MGRVTQAQKIERENEESALEHFEGMLAGLADPRRPQGVRYPLRTVVVTALMASVCGSDDAESMALWAKINAEWLAEFLPMPHGPPTQDVYLSVFGALDPEAFATVFRSWAHLLSLRLEAQGKHIAVDGKTVRRSADEGGSPVHVVSAWTSEAGLVLGQRATGHKSNEITAIPELLSVLDLRGATVTLDAIGCQTEIAKQVVDGEGHYVLAVKGNQPALREDVETTFLEADDARKRTCDEAARPQVEVFEETEKGHGRVEKRMVSLCRDLTWMTCAGRWPGLSYVVRVKRERTVVSTGTTSEETAYYIGSDEAASAEKVARAVRRHWSVENELHWVLDLAFREDEARHRANNAARNLTTLRHFALNLLKGDKSRKVGVANSRKRAGWDRAYLLELLTGA